MKWHVPPKWSSHVGKCPLQPLSLRKEALNPYCGKYQGQTGATGSRVYKDKENS